MCLKLAKHTLRMDKKIGYPENVTHEKSPKSHLKQKSRHKTRRRPKNLSKCILKRFRHI